MAVSGISFLQIAAKTGFLKNIAIGIVSIFLLGLGAKLLFTEGQMRQHKGSNIDVIDPTPFATKHTVLGLRNVQVLAADNTRFVSRNIIMDDTRILDVTGADTLLHNVEYIDGSGRLSISSEMTMTKNSLIAALAMTLLLSSLDVFADEVGGEVESSEIEKAALAVVAKRIDAYNNHDLDAYLAAHDEDLEIYEYPEKSIGKGRSHLKMIFGPIIDRGVGKVIVKHQSVVGNTVVSEEVVGFGGPDMQHLVAIYTVERGLITVVRLIESD